MVKILLIYWRCIDVHTCWSFVRTNCLSFDLKISEKTIFCNMWFKDAWKIRLVTSNLMILIYSMLYEYQSTITVTYRTMCSWFFSKSEYGNSWRFRILGLSMSFLIPWAHHLAWPCFCCSFFLEVNIVEVLILIFFQFGERNTGPLSRRRSEGEQRWVEGKFWVVCVVDYKEKQTYTPFFLFG